jgi:hypothetical protein
MYLQDSTPDGAALLSTRVQLFYNGTDKPVKTVPPSVGSLHEVAPDHHIEWALTFDARDTKRWAGYRLVLRGDRLGSRAAVEGRPALYQFGTSPRLNDAILNWDSTGTAPPPPAGQFWQRYVALHEQRAYVGTSPLYAYIRWHPTRGEERGVHRPPTYSASADDWRAAATALTGLQDLSRPIAVKPSQTVEQARARLSEWGRRAMRRRDCYPEDLTYALLGFEAGFRSKTSGIAAVFDRADWTGIGDLRRWLEDRRDDPDV